MKIKLTFNNQKHLKDYYILSLTPNLFLNYRKHELRLVTGIGTEHLPLWYLSIGIKWLSYSVAVSIKQFNK